MSIGSICLALVFVSLVFPCLLFLRSNHLTSGVFNKNNIEESNSDIKNSYHISVIMLFGLFFTLYGINLYFPLEYRHTDSIGYLNSVIPPQIFSGRVFPFGHQEFNIITLKSVGFIGLFTIPFVQSVMSIFLLYKIVPIKNRNIRLLLIIPIFCSALAIPYSNLIIPERNQLFLLLLFLYFTFESNVSWKIKLGLFFANFSLYYKEPTFLIYLAFSLAMIFLKLNKKNITFRDLFNITSWYKKMPLELYLMIMSISFVTIYLVIQFLQPSDSFYGQGQSYYNHFMSILSMRSLIRYPFILLSLSMSVVFIFKGIKSENMSRAFVLFVAANAYALGIFVLKMPIGYYYFDAANLLIMLSCCHYFSSDKNQTSILRDKLKILISIIVAFFVIQTSLISFIDLKNSKLQQIGFNKISNYLHELKGKDDNKVMSIYYNTNLGPPDYRTSVMKLIIMDKIKKDFIIYSESGCYPWHATSDDGHYQCRKNNFYLTNDYDFIIDDTLDMNGLYKNYVEYTDSMFPFKTDIKILYKK
jgi:hypothetical protein